MTSLSTDYVLTLVLAVVLGVKYIVFDHDDEPQSQDDTVTMTTVPAAAAGDQLSASVKGGAGSAGQSEQIDDVEDEALHREPTDDITPTASSLNGELLGNL